MNHIWNNYVAVLKKYADFNGRAGRGEFWWFFLMNLIIGIVLGMFTRNLPEIYSLIVFIPTIAVGARRLHDTGKSGWLQLIGLIPVLGIIILLILFAQPTKRA